MKFGKNITKRRTLALRIRGMEVSVAAWRKPGVGVEREVGQPPGAHAAI